MSKLVKNTAIYTIGNIFPQIAGYILLPIYTSYLDPFQFGIVTSVQVFQSITSVFFGLCLDRSIMRLYWDFKNDDDKTKFISTITIAVFLSSIIIFVLFIASNKFIGKLYKEVSFYPYLFMGTIISCILSFFNVPKVLLMLKEKAVLFVTLSIMQFILINTFILWFIIRQQEGAVGYLKGYIIGLISIAPFYLFINLKSIRIKFDLRMLKSALKFSIPFIPTLVSAWIFNFFDRVLIERFIDLNNVGIYSLGYRIASVVLVIGSAFNLAYDPIFYRLANSENQAIAKEKILNYNHTIISLIGLLAIFLAIISKELVVVLFTSNYHQAHFIIPIFCMVFYLNILSGFVGRLYQQNKKTLLNMLLAVIFSFLNIGINLILIPKLGINGSAISAVITSLTGLLVSYVVAKKFSFFITFKWKKIIPLPFLSAILIILYDVFSPFNLLTNLIIKSLFIFIILIFVWKDYKDKIKSIIKEK